MRVSEREGRKEGAKRKRAEIHDLRTLYFRRTGLRDYGQRVEV